LKKCCGSVDVFGDAMFERSVAAGWPDHPLPEGAPVVVSFELVLPPPVRVGQVTDESCA
jgi:hypothetical protein